MDVRLGTLGLGLGKGYAYTAAATTGILSTALVFLGGVLVISGIIGIVKKNKEAKA